MKMRRLSALAKIFLLILAVWSPPAKSQDNNLGDRLKEVEKAIEAGKINAHRLRRQAETLQHDLKRASRKRVSLAESVQNLETKVSELEREIDDLNKAENEKKSLLAARREQFSHVLLALQRLSQLPPEAVVAFPAKASDLVRTAILLKSTVPQIEDQAGRLREDLIALSATRKLIASRKSDLDRFGQDLHIKRGRLEKLISEKSAARKITLAARQRESIRVKRLSLEARNLRDLFRGLEKERLKGLEEERKTKEKQRLKIQRQKVPDAEKQSPEQPGKLKPLARLTSPLPLKPFALAKGSLRYPVVGRTINLYGDRVRRGISHKGITLETRPGAQVVAPYDGKVVFAGNFRGYGKLLIIEHGEGYHSLIAGMTRIDGILGQRLLSGEPVGIMQSRDGKKPSLYLELRRNGQPINPVPWLVAGKGKTNR